MHSVWYNTGFCAVYMYHRVFMVSAVSSESPCCTGRRDLVLPQSAVTQGSANTELHFKLWSCCPCRTSSQAARQTAREIRGERFFSFFPFLPEPFQPSVHFLSLYHILATFFPLLTVSFLLCLYLYHLCISSMKNLWQMFLPHSTFQGLTGSHMLVAQSRSPLSHR